MDDFVALEHSLGTDATNIDTPPPSLLVEQRLKPSRLVARLAQYLDRLQQHLGSAMHPAYAQFIGGDRDQRPGQLQGRGEAQAQRSEMEQAQKEVEVEMPKHSGLGLVLEEDEEAEFQVVVDGFAPIDDSGRAGPAESSGLVHVGDAIVAVQGRSMRQLGYDEVLSSIKQAPDPVIICFARLGDTVCGLTQKATLAGTLRVTARCARALYEAHPHQNPYAVVEIRPGGERRGTDCIYSGGNCPTWNAGHGNQMSFELCDVAMACQSGSHCDTLLRSELDIVVEIWDRRQTSDEKVGSAVARLPALDLGNMAPPLITQFALDRSVRVDTGGDVDIQLNVSGKLSPFSPPHQEMQTPPPPPYHTESCTAGRDVTMLKRDGLGLVLEEDEEAEFQVVVDGFAPIDDSGRAGPAESSGLVHVGDAIVAVQGRSMRQLGYDEVLSSIKQAPDPLTIRFWRAMEASPPVVTNPATPVPTTDNSIETPNLTDDQAFQAEKLAIEKRHNLARQLASQQGAWFDEEEDTLPFHEEPANDATLAYQHAKGDVELELDTAEGLGVRLQEDCDADYHVTVDEFVPLEDGSAGPVERSGVVLPGYVILDVAGRSMLGLPYDEVLHCIMTAPNPIKIRFGEVHQSPPSTVAGFLKACSLSQHESRVCAELTPDLHALMEQVLNDFDGVAKKLELAGLDEVEISSLLVALTDAVSNDAEHDAMPDPLPESATKTLAHGAALSPEISTPQSDGVQPSSTTRATSITSLLQPRAHVELDKSNGLGLVLVDDDKFNGATVVLDFAELSNGETGPAQACGSIFVGDIVCSVNGCDVLGMEHDDVLQLISDSPPMVKISFASQPSSPEKIQHPGVVGVQGDNPDNEDDAEGEIEGVNHTAMLAGEAAGVSSAVLHAAISPAFRKRQALVAARRTAGKFVPVMYTSSTKSTLKMESDERRMIQILDAKNVPYDMVFVDIDLEKRNELNQHAAVPQFHIDGKYVGDFETLQELEDMGTFSMILIQTGAVDYNF
eukprot:g2837.t1